MPPLDYTLTYYLVYVTGLMINTTNSLKKLHFITSINHYQKIAKGQVLLFIGSVDMHLTVLYIKQTGMEKKQTNVMGSFCWVNDPWSCQ